jgi:hypothetical protein
MGWFSSDSTVENRFEQDITTTNIDDRDLTQIKEEVTPEIVGAVLEYSNQIISSQQELTSQYAQNVNNAIVANAQVTREARQTVESALDDAFSFAGEQGDRLQTVATNAQNAIKDFGQRALATIEGITPAGADKRLMQAGGIALAAFAAWAYFSKGKK